MKNNNKRTSAEEIEDAVMCAVLAVCAIAVVVFLVWKEVFA